MKILQLEMKISEELVTKVNSTKFCRYPISAANTQFLISMVKDDRYPMKSKVNETLRTIINFCSVVE